MSEPAPTAQALAALLGRLLLAAIFLVEGVMKLGDLSGVGAYVAGYGVSPVLLPLVVLTEIGGGLMVAAGFRTRFAAVALAGFCLLTAAFFHRDYGDPEQLIHLGKNLAMAGGFLVLAAFGPGDWSVDARRR